MYPLPLHSTLLPYTTLFRSGTAPAACGGPRVDAGPATGGGAADDGLGSVAAHCGGTEPGAGMDAERPASAAGRLRRGVSEMPGGLVAVRSGAHRRDGAAGHRPDREIGSASWRDRA